MGPNRKAVGAVIRAMQQLGHLEDVDAAWVAAVKSIADAVDDDTANASLWREYRALLTQLRVLGQADGPNDLDSLIDALRAPVGDA